MNTIRRQSAMLTRIHIPSVIPLARSAFSTIPEFQAIDLNYKEHTGPRTGGTSIGVHPIVISSSHMSTIWCTCILLMPICCVCFPVDHISLISSPEGSSHYPAWIDGPLE